MPAYVHIDVSQKQEYIYKNSKLVDNLYNSFIIKAVTERLTEGHTEEWEKLEQSLKANKIVYLQKYLEEFHSKYELKYYGGGNSIISFESDGAAKEFIKGYSLEVLKVYPDLELYITLLKEDVAKTLDDMQIRKELLNKSDKQKDKRKGCFKRWSYGIEEIAEGGRPQPLGTGNAVESTNNKEELKEAARKYLFDKFENPEENLKSENIKYTYELDYYKKHEDGKSYIGVISIDGNKMGDMVKKTKNFEELKNLSKEIDTIYSKAILKALKEHADKLNNKKLLVTPILQAGDDICLIVEGVYAVQIAAQIIKNIKIASEESRDEALKGIIGTGYLTACGGVAIARNTYPYFEAIKIAENLCHKAKEAIYKDKSIQTRTLQSGSFLSWEVIQSQVSTNDEYISYVKNGKAKDKYHIKPLRIDPISPINEDIFSYDAFHELFKEIDTELKKDKPKISSSFLEGLKNQMYSGIEQYKLYLDTNKEQAELMKKMVAEAFDTKSCKHMIYEDQSENSIYLLNDMLEVLPFMTKLEEKAHEQA